MSATRSLAPTTAPLELFSRSKQLPLLLFSLSLSLYCFLPSLPSLLPNPLLRPRSEKSTTQKAGDYARGGSDDTKDQSKGIAQTVTDTVHGATQSAKDTVSSMTGNK